MPYDPTPMGDSYFSSIQWDEKGNPFQLTQSGKRSYIPPAAAATSDANDPVGQRLVQWAASKGATYANPGGASPQGGFAHNRGTFDQSTGEWDRGNFFNTPLGALILGGGTMAAGPIASAFMGAGGGAAPLASTPVGSGFIPAIEGGSGLASATGGVGGATTAALGGAAAPLASTPVGAGFIPGIEGGSGLATEAGAGGAAAASQIPNGYPGSEGYAQGNTYPNGIENAGLSLLDSKWSPLLKALAGVGGLMGGKYLGDQASQNAVPPQLSQLLDLAMQRANAQTPLFNAVNKGTYDMLPDFAKKGGT